MSLSKLLFNFLKEYHNMSKKINTIILDDNQNSIDELSNLLHFYDYINLVGSFTKFSDLWQILKKSDQTIQLIFLDILLVNENGLDVAKLINEHYPNVKIIFSTSDPSFALEAYDTQPVDYLTKPISAVRLQKSLTRVRNLTSQSTRPESDHVKIGIKYKNTLHMIEVNKVAIIKKSLRHIKITLISGEIFTTTEGIHDLYLKLKRFGFVMINRSTIVPIHQISAIDYNQSKQNYVLKLLNGQQISGISKLRLKEVKADLSEFDWII